MWRKRRRLEEVIADQDALINSQTVEIGELRERIHNIQARCDNMELEIYRTIFSKIQINIDGGDLR